MIVQLKEGAATADHKLVAVCEERIARYKVPKAFIRTSKIVRSPAGKADYRWAKSLAIQTGTTRLRPAVRSEPVYDSDANDSGRTGRGGVAVGLSASVERAAPRIWRTVILSRSQLRFLRRRVLALEAPSAVTSRNTRKHTASTRTRRVTQ